VNKIKERSKRSNVIKIEKWNERKNSGAFVTSVLIYANKKSPE